MWLPDKISVAEKFHLINAIKMTIKRNSSTHF